MVSTAMQMLLPQSIAWYGKLASRGDFVSRGMPRPWQRTWDDWLQRGLICATQQLGADALREHLPAMPPWQCVVWPTQEDAPLWCGAVVPSSDRVGRLFPLLLMESYDVAVLREVALTALRDRALQLSHWLVEATQASTPLKEFERGTTALANTAWNGSPDGPVDGETSVAVLHETWPAAQTFWWCEARDPDRSAPPLAEAWPPRDALVLEWIDGPN